MSGAPSTALHGRKLKIRFGDLVAMAGGLEAAEGFCRVGKSTLARYYSLAPADAECFAPIDVVRDLERLVGEAPVTSHLCVEAAGVFVSLPGVEAGAGDVFAALSSLSREMSDITTAVCDGFNDGEFGKADAAKTIREVNDVIERAAQMRALLQSIAGDQA